MAKIKYTTLEVTVLALAEVAANGFTGKGKPGSTYDVVRAKVHPYNIMIKRGSSPNSDYDTAIHAVPQDKINEANDVIRWIQTEKKVKTDFDIALRSVFSNTLLTEKQVSIAVCAAQAWKNKKRWDMVAEENKKKNAGSKFLGEIGKRAEFFIKVIGKKDISTQFGESTVFNVIDREGNLGVWFSNPGKIDLEVNDCALIKATVKHHGENLYKGGRETLWNRVKVLNNAGAV
tara:strand:+ start:5151 stop:5846 length:696 start_codon:yes stop_codon:yes gene_type:complete